MVKAATPKTPKTPKSSSKAPKRKEPAKTDEIIEIKVFPILNKIHSENQPENEAKRPKQQPGLLDFFKPKEKPAPPPTVPQCMPEASRFRTLFQLKEGVKLAPMLYREPLTAEKHDQLLKSQSNEPSDYLAQCKGKPKRRASNTDLLKAKYFHFHNIYRPPYYGTWRQLSKAITGRRPFSKEEKTINYEYDSDEDWEEEPDDAEECRSEDEDVEKDDDQSAEEDDDGFFVDHGYLSTDEGSGAEEDELVKPKLGENENKPNAMETEEQRRQRMEEKAQEWKDQQRQKERRYKKRQLVPTVYLPAESIHPILHRNILAGVLFDYASLVPKQPPPMETAIEPTALSTVPSTSGACVAATSG